MSTQGPVERIPQASKDAGRVHTFSHQFELRPNWVTQRLLTLGCRVGCAAIVLGSVAGCVGCWNLLQR